jgi:hypothetical protein
MKGAMLKSALVTVCISIFCSSPAFALSFSGSASLDWSALTMTGVSVTLSNFQQLASANVGSLQGSGFASAITESNDWLPATTGGVSLFSVGNGTGSLSNTSINGSLSLFSNYAFGSAGGFRNVEFTALNTGILTVSIPYLLQTQGPISGEWSSVTSASIQFTNLDHTGGIADGFSFEHTNDGLNASGETKSGIASISIPVSQGQTGLLNFDTRVGASVPEPATFWSLAIGLVMLGLPHSRVTRPIADARVQ